MPEIQNIKVRIVADADFSDLDQSLQKLTAEEKALKEQLKAVGEEANKAGKALSEETQKADNAVKSTNKSFKDLKGSVSELSQNIPGAFQVGQVQAFTAQLGVARTAIMGVVTQLGALKVAMIGTGIGALIVALGSLFAFFKKTEQGSEMLERGLAKIGAVVDVIIGKFANLGKGIVQLFSGEWKQAVETFRSAFDNIGKDILNASEQAGKFTEELQDIEDAEKLLGLEIAKTRNQIQLLLIQSRNRATTEAERLELLKQAEQLESGIIAKQIALQERKVLALIRENNLKRESGEIDKGNKTDELIQAEIELENLKGNSYELLGKIQNREDLLLLAQEERIAKEKAYWDMREREMTKDLNLQKKTNDDGLKAFDDTEKHKNDLHAKALKIKDDQRKKDEEEAKKTLDRDVANAIEAEKQKQEARQQATQLAIEITNGFFQLAQEKRQVELQELQFQQQQELKAVGDNKQAQAVINARYAREVAKIKQKEAIADKEQALFNIGVQTAQNVVKSFPNPILMALAGALGVAQAGFVLARPIPKFNKGTKSVPGFDTGDDSVLSMLRPGEGVMPVDRMKDYKPAFDAIFDRKVSPEMLNSFVMDYGKLDKAITVNNNTADLGGLKSELRSMSKKLDKLQILNVQMDQKGFKAYLSKGESKTQLENNYLRVG